jgi:hypothetical protein
MKAMLAGEHLSIAVNLCGEELIDWSRKNLC